MDLIELHRQRTIIWLAAICAVAVLAIGTIGAVSYIANHSSPYNGEGR